jgi:hypothetical protein
MVAYRDLSYNGPGGVSLNQNGRGDAVDISTTDYSVVSGNRLFVTGAGNLVLRYPSSSADITITAPVNSLFPVVPGTIIRKTGTTTTGMFALPA